jgi:hypothetical protein
MAAVGGLWWLARGSGRLRDDGAVARVLAAPGDVLREQVRSPGQRLLGTRTVDRRTGRRLALWRTLVIVVTGAAGQELTRRLRSPETREQEREREAFVAEMRSITEHHPQASPERDAEREALFERPPPPQANLWRAVAPPLAAGLATTLLRRRLARTVEVLAKRQSP